MSSEPVIFHTRFMPGPDHVDHELARTCQHLFQVQWYDDIPHAGPNIRTHIRICCACRMYSFGMFGFVALRVSGDEPGPDVMDHLPDDADEVHP